MGKQKKGFALIEVLLIVVILGIIAAIVIPRLMASKAEAEATVEATMNLGKIPALEEAIKEKTGKYLECPEAGSVIPWQGNKEFDKLGFSLTEEYNKSKLKYKIALAIDGGYVATATFNNGMDAISWYLTDRNDTVFRRVE